MPLLILLFNAGAQPQDKVEWQEDLTAACKKAASENKLVLCRQIVCPCKEADCALRRYGPHPWYMAEEAIRRLISEKFVAVAVHVSPGKELDTLADPGWTSKIGIASETIRTLFLTPTRQIVHRLDICPSFKDVRPEFELALKIRDECFDEKFVPRRGGLLRVFDLQREHINNVERYHKGAPPDPGYRFEATWLRDLRQARQLAKKTGRLIFYFQVVGELDQPEC